MKTVHIVFIASAEQIDVKILCIRAFKMSIIGTASSHNKKIAHFY